MKIYEILLIGVALAIDACALTIANCTTYKNDLDRKKEWLMPIFFGVFQAVMPLIGYLFGSLFSSVINPVSKFITCGIFLLLAIKIFIDILKERREECRLQEVKSSDCKKLKFTLSILIVQALATSIDALMVGITLVNLSFSVFIAISIIGAVTFVLVLFALYFGKRLGKLFGNYAEWVGAVILFGLSIKSLIEGLI